MPVILYMMDSYVSIIHFLRMTNIGPTQNQVNHMVKTTTDFTDHTDKSLQKYINRLLQLVGLIGRQRSHIQNVILITQRHPSVFILFYPCILLCFFPVSCYTSSLYPAMLLYIHLLYQPHQILRLELLTHQ